MAGKIIIIVIIACMIGAITFGSGLLTIADSTDGVSYKDDVYEGNALSAGIGTDLLDWASYVTSWTPGGLSEKIVLQGIIHKWSSHSLWQLYGYKYVVTVVGTGADSIAIGGVKGSTYTKEYSASEIGNAGTGNINTKTLVLQITGPCTGVLTAELWVNRNYNLGSASWVKICSDKADLRSGVGSIQMANDKVEEGTPAKINIVTGWANSEGESGAWKLTVTNNFSKLQIYEEELPDNFNGQKSITIPVGSFDPVNPTGNTCTVTLLNTLLMQDEDTFFTIKQGAMGRTPAKPTFNITAGEAPYVAGSNVTVEIKSAVKYNDIKGFQIWIVQQTDIGQTTRYVVNDEWVTVDGTKTIDGVEYAYISYSWKFPDASRYVLQASAVDSENLNSGKSTLNFRTMQPDDVGGQITEFDWMPILLIGIIMMVIGAVLSFLPVPVPKEVKTLGMVLLFVGVILTIISVLFIYGFITLMPSTGV